MFLVSPLQLVSINLCLNILRGIIELEYFFHGSGGVMGNTLVPWPFLEIRCFTLS